MLGYIAEALQRFKHIWTYKPKDQSYAHVTPHCGAKVQYAPDADKSRSANKVEKQVVQQVVGTFLYYGRAVNSTMLTAALSAIASKQASPTKNTLQKVRKFMNYTVIHPDAILIYCKSDIILTVHSD